MKKIAGFCVGILILLNCFGVSAQEIESKEISKQERIAEKPHFKGLELSEEQKVQFEEIRKNIVLDRFALKQASETDNDSAVKMVEEYQQKIATAFKEILTKEQLEHYEKNMKTLDRMKELNLNNQKQSNPK